MTFIKMMFGMRVHKTVIQLSHKHISNHCESKHVQQTRLSVTESDSSTSSLVR